MKFLICCPVFNCPDLLDRAIASVAGQQGEDWSLVIADDASPDRKVAEIAWSWMDELPNQQVIFLRQPIHVGTLANQAQAIRACTQGPDDVIVFVDGDDRLSHPRVLSRLAQEYRDPSVQLTYGSYRSVPHSPTCTQARAFPPEVVRKGSYRACIREGGGQRFNHLRTMRRRIFDALTDNDLMVDGRWPHAGGDFVMMLPAMELAGEGVRVIPDVLYEYRSDREDSDWRIRGHEIKRVSEAVLARPRKQPLDVPC